ncbi:MAG: acyltransferase family protein [Solirubrobacterales bacterium]
MPEPIGKSGQRYMPGLDGLRAIAVIAVIAYHLEVPFTPGGLLGVGMFFTLSGYLITDILLEAWTGRRLKLGQFWLARARRLLPALFVMLIVVTAWVSLGAPEQLDDLRGMVVSSALFTSNWWVIFQDQSYFDRFGPTSPMGHLWSLAIEEQFYLIWPWVLLLGLRFIPSGDRATKRGQRERIRPRLAAVTVGLAVVSAILMAVLYQPGFDMTRVYEGTDTRAFGLLLGAALAMMWPSRRLGNRIPAKARNQLDGAGIFAFVVIAVLIWQTDEYSAFLYRGGLVILTLATVVVVAVMAHPASRLGRAIGWEPLRWIGVRSYGIYLWQLPIIALTTPAINNEFNPLRALLQVIAIFGISALSWKFIEDPVRHGAVGRIWAKLRDSSWRPEWKSPTGAAIIGSGLVALIALLALVGIAPNNRVAPLAVKISAESPEILTAEPVVTQKVVETVDGKLPLTSCASVAYIGDSTSVGLMSLDYLPEDDTRLDSQFARVGAADQRFDISGARSIYETVDGNPNAYDAGNALKLGGFNGCWAFGMGTNDTANQFVGSTIDSAARIEQMMSVVGDEPAMWVNVRSLETSGPYAEVNMEAWNDALMEACGRYPNMRVYDWASKVKDEWFVADGIHFTSEGYTVRSREIASALARAFPSSWQVSLGRPESCLIS